MRISQRLDYALRTVAALAAKPSDSYVGAGDLADNLQLPRRFVEQQVTALVRAGIVKSRRGSSGGVALARPVAEISVRDIMVALEGDVVDAPKQANSAVAEMWQGFADIADSYLGTIKISELVMRQAELDCATAPMFYI